jgi:hypothetical protein
MIQRTPTRQQDNDETWAIQHAAYLAEKEAGESHSYKQRAKPEHVHISEDESWEIQYAAYCAAKEAKNSSGNIERND